MIASVLLTLTLVWALYNEFFGLRPWRDYQNRFRTLYGSYLRKQIAQRRAAEQALYATPDYQKLKAAVDAAGSASLPSDHQIQAQIDLLDRQRAILTPDFQDARGKVGALTYQPDKFPKATKAPKLPS